MDCGQSGRDGAGASQSGPSMVKACERRSPMTPGVRIRRCNRAPVNAGGAFVLYWMTSARRMCMNFALDRAVELCLGHRVPLLVLEPLRAGYRWASARIHRFVIDGMADNLGRCAAHGVAYYPYVEPRPGAGSGLLEALAHEASVVVTDDYPAFFLPRMLRAAAARLPVRLEAVDSNGLLPLAATERPFATAYAFRRFLQRELPSHLGASPHPDPLPLLAPILAASGVRDSRPCARVKPGILERWPVADVADPAGLIRDLPVDHAVPAADVQGGPRAAMKRWMSFADSALAHYATQASRPEAEATSRLAPYLHFGHISVHDVWDGIARREGWTPDHLACDARGRRRGWWGLSEGAESYLDQVVTWRELGFVRCTHVEHYGSYESLPKWARATLEEHRADRREFLYSPEEFEAAATHDPLWNAAQNQLLGEGRIHNYMRMLWGKKILEWSPSPQDALRTMVHLNNKYGLDGRDPNSWTGILWTLGLHDRPWGPERPVYGKVRYMSSANTARKFRVLGYIDAYARP